MITRRPLLQVASRSSGSQNARRTANLPDDVAFTVCGWARQLVDTNAFAALVSLEDAGQAHYIQLSTATDGTTLQVFTEASTAGTVKALPLNQDFFWSVSSSALTAAANIGRYRAQQENTLTSGNATGTARAAMTPTSLYIGNDSSGAEGWNGRIWNVMCWDRALTEAELLYQSYYQHPIDPSAINFWWPMDTANVIADFSRNRRDATITGTWTAERAEVYLRQRRFPRRVVFLPSSGAISGTATITFGQSGDLKGAGALSGSAAITFGQSGTLRGAGAVAGSTTITFGQSGTLLGAGALAGTTAITFGQSGALVGAGSLSGSASFTFNASATADTPSGALSGTATITFSQSGTLTGSGNLAGSTTIVFGASGTLSDASGPAAPARSGGDDVPRHKRVEIYEKATKRHRITLERDRDLSQELTELFRSLTGDPETREAAVEIVKPVRDSLPLESLRVGGVAREIVARKLVDIEIALRMLETERRKAVRRREDDEHESTAIELLLSNIL